MISFLGEVTSDCIPIFNACFKEVNSVTSTSDVVLNFQGVYDVDASGIRPLAQLQIILRDKFRIYLCCLKSSIEKELEEAGILRRQEVFPDLLKTVQFIINLSEKK